MSAHALVGRRTLTALLVSAPSDALGLGMKSGEDLKGSDEPAAGQQLPFERRDEPRHVDTRLQIACLLGQLQVITLAMLPVFGSCRQRIQGRKIPNYSRASCCLSVHCFRCRAGQREVHRSLL